jgi:hypothetical protein
MTQYFGDDGQYGTYFQQAGGQAMAQGMRTKLFTLDADTCFAKSSLYDLRNYVTG